MLGTIFLFMLLSTTANLAFAEEPGKKSFDLQKPTPEHEADLRKTFMAQVSRDLASRKEHVISRHMFLTDFIAKSEQEKKAIKSQGDALKQRFDQKGYWNPEEEADFDQGTKSKDTYSRLINRGKHEQRFLVQQYRLLTQLEELEDELRKKELTKVDYLHQKALVSEALMRTSQSIMFEEMVGDMVNSLNAGLTGIKSELSLIGQTMPVRR